MVDHRHAAAVALSRVALAKLSEDCWRADSLVHLGDMDVASVARRLGVGRPQVLRMLAAVTAAKDLAAHADGLRPQEAFTADGRGGGRRASAAARELMDVT